MDFNQLENAIAEGLDNIQDYEKLLNEINNEKNDLN